MSSPTVDQPVRFTIRALLFATFWAGVSFWAFAFARVLARGAPTAASSVEASMLFVLGILSLCAALYMLFKKTPAKDKSSMAKSRLAAIAIWNVVAYIATLIYIKTIGPLLLVAYEAYFGDVQASYASWERVEHFVRYASITFPASMIAVWLVHRLSRQAWTWRQSWLTIAVWETLVVLVLVITSSELAYAIGQVNWVLFGPPDNLYGFRNFLLPFVLGWLIETTPVAWTSLWLHSRLT